jgi:SAM-dependent MidA family methyltransferase
MRRPDPVLLVELGPGRGTLMADALRACAEVAPAFRRAVRIHLVEQSPRLRAAQRTRLNGAIAAWHEDLATLPDGPALILANEFFDALPIRQFVRRGTAWTERHVENNAFVELPASDHPKLPHRLPEGGIAETCEPARAIATTLGARITQSGGAALVLDYGGEGGIGDTLQAVRAHAYADPLAAEPGTVDLTAHLDFAALAAAARAAGAAAHGPLPQGLLLQRLGLMSRAAILARANPARAAEQLSAAQRLVAPEQMGRLFRALCLCDPSLPTPPGFEPA